MGAEPLHDWHQTLASTLEWWRDAGVDMLVEDDPRDWLARPAPQPETPAGAPAPIAKIAPPPEILPDTLEAFVAWRMGDKAPEAGWMTPRFAPTGDAAAEWVILTDMPEPDDTEALLSGAPGRLLDRMLAAIGLTRDAVYLMPLAWARPLSGRIPPEQFARLVELAQHQLALLKPRKLLIFGQTASRAIDATDGFPSGDSIQEVNQFGVKTQAVATFPPRFLLERPVAKSEAWKHLLLLSRGPAE
jgi:uracil-DNA glycosylase